jgi:Tubulin like
MAMQALVMGFGGTGTHILTALKELTVLKHGSMPDSIKFLLFDTIADWEPGKAVPIRGGAAKEEVAKSSEEAANLDKFTEYFYLEDHDPDLKRHVYTHLSRAGQPDSYPHLKDWLHAPWLSEHVEESRLNVTEGAAQQRQIGRFAMFQNEDKIVERISGLIRSLAQQALSATVNVWVIGSSAGGTGAGCLLDAAYMTRLAARAAGDLDITLTGVIVLPDVYNGVAGISAARAYSLLRELDRVQLQGIPESDKYEDPSGHSSELIASEVTYEARGKHVARLRAKLFDDLFYLGQVCSSKEQREAFFTSVANAIDPYLDANSGPELLRASVNETAAASAFGAARLYVPVKTLAELFAWEQVEEYLKGAAAPRERDRRVVGINSGSAPDRRAAAKTKVENMLLLFGEILQQVDWSDDKKETWARGSALDSEKIIAGWYQFAGAAIADEKLTDAEARTVLLTYVDPFVSFKHTDPSKVTPQDRETKTFRENRDAKGVRESQEESRDRFANSLEALVSQYTNAAGGERTFEKGRRLVYEKVSWRLRARVDNTLIEELQQRGAFAADPDNPDEGTALTRLYEELGHIVGEGGPLRGIDATIGKFLDTLNAEAARREQQPVDALRDLRSSRRTGFNPLGVWVETYQQAARAECAEYIGWYQKRALLKDMQLIVRSVLGRFAAWERAVGKVIDALVLREGESALYSVRRKYIQQLEDRLSRASKNPSALISFVKSDDGMHGYRDRLRESSVYASEDVTLASAALAASRWEAAVAADGSPELRLVVNQSGGVTYAPDAIKNLHFNLQQHFRAEIERVLDTTDIFDYLVYLRETRDLEPSGIAKHLDEAATTLVNAGRASEESKLIYKAPTDKKKTDLATLIQGALGGGGDPSVKDPEDSHSDQNSITLLKVKKPNLSEIVNVDDCRLDYSRMQIGKLTGDARLDNELYRAQVYHPLRPEQEAWFIERRHWLDNGIRPDHLTPPRVTRLLEHPDLMHAFVQCVAAGAIEKAGQEWVWHASFRDVKLSDYENDSNADVLRAAIVFTLQQREVGRNTQSISLADARQSAMEGARKRGKTLDELLEDFRKNRLDQFLSEFFPDGKNSDEGKALRMVFDFYANPSTRTGLQHRMKL